MGLISITLPIDGEGIDSSDVNTPFNTIKDCINGNIDENNIANGAVTQAKLAATAVTSANTSLTIAQATFDSGAQTNTSYGAIGTQISVTTTVANQVIWANFAGNLHISKVSGGTYVNARVSVLLGGASKAATF